MTRHLALASLGLALFIVCPRMAGMTNIIARHSNSSLLLIALCGTIISIPLVMTMVLVYERLGLWGALTFCVLTDLAAAFFIKDLSLRAGLETLIIALFVLLGVKLAPPICNLLIK